MHMPHASSHSTQLTSRAVLFQDEEFGALTPRHEQELSQEVQRLHEVVRRSLGNFEMCPPRTKPRKLDNIASTEVDTLPTTIPFRLISWTLPAQPIRLMPAHHSGVRRQRPTEDTADEAETRELWAQEAAVDANRILASSCTSIPKVTFPATDTFMLSDPSINPSRLPNLLVTEHRQSPTKTSASREYEMDLESSSVKCCPLVPVIDQAVNGKPKQKRKRKQPAVRDRPSPRFFRPMQEWGGKSAGYAMGWQASWPANRPALRRYIRDKMRKGTLGHLN